MVIPTRPCMHTSRPSQGAWIETDPISLIAHLAPRSRPSQGAWIETASRGRDCARKCCRALHRARGLKLEGRAAAVFVIPVAPFTGRVD